MLLFPCNSQDREHILSTQTTANRHNSQTKHRAPSHTVSNAYCVEATWLVSQGCIGVLGNAAALGDGAEIDCCDVPPEWADHLTSAEFAFRCWLCSASADVMMEHMVVTKE